MPGASIACIMTITTSSISCKSDGGKDGPGGCGPFIHIGFWSALHMGEILKWEPLKVWNNETQEYRFRIANLMSRGHQNCPPQLLNWILISFGLMWSSRKFWDQRGYNRIPRKNIGFHPSRTSPNSIVCLTLTRWAHCCWWVTILYIIT